jgi:hypothetical protein
MMLTHTLQQRPPLLRFITAAAARVRSGACYRFSRYYPIMLSSPSNAENLSQLVRYELTIDNMCAPDCLSWVRQRLAALGLVVDQVHVRGAEVASTHVNGPDLDAIQAALREGGYQLVQAKTKVG